MFKNAVGSRKGKYSVHPSPNKSIDLASVFIDGGRRCAVLPYVLMVGLFTAGSAVGAALDDPTRPPFFMATGKKPPTVIRRKTPKVWELTSTLISPQRKVAVINGRTVSEGDRIDKAIVVKITHASVRLRRGTRDFTVVLFPNLVTKRTVVGSRR